MNQWLRGGGDDGDYGVHRVSEPVVHSCWNCLSTLTTAQNTVLEIQKTVTAYLESEQLPPFGFTRRNTLLWDPFK